MNIRFFGINAPELNTDAGKAARNHLTGLLGATTFAPVSLVIRTIKDAADKYGERWDGNIWLESDGVWSADFAFATTAPSLNQRMVADGFAVVYP